MDENYRAKPIDRRKQYLKNHLIPFFGDIPFSYFNPMLIQRFVSHMAEKKSKYGQPFKKDSILNTLKPLRKITKAAISEYQWDLSNPFQDLEYPKDVKTTEIKPLTRDEWDLLLKVKNPDG